MVCLGCRTWGSEIVCRRCLLRRRSGGVQRLVSGLVVRSAFVHDGTPRDVVHRLKFEGLLPAAQWLALHMAPLVAGIPVALVPVPRTGVRRVRYGVDAAYVLARFLGGFTGRPVEQALRAPVWARAHTGRDSVRRARPIFFSTAGNGPILLVDDVITTGSTLLAAAGQLNGRVVGAVTATRTMKVTSLSGEEASGSGSTEAPRSEVERGSSSPR